MEALWESFSDLVCAEKALETRVRRYSQQNRSLLKMAVKLQEELVRTGEEVQRYKRTVMTEARKEIKCNPNYGSRTTVSGHPGSIPPSPFTDPGTQLIVSPFQQGATK